LRASPNLGSSGDAGTVNLTVDGLLEVLNGAQISSSTSGAGKAGEVTIAAGSARLDGLGTPDQFTGVASGAWSWFSGDAGTVSLTVDGLLEVLNGAFILSSTLGSGKAGVVMIAAGSARLDGLGTPDQFTGVASNANSGSSGDAGTVSLTVDGLLEVLNGATIGSGTFAEGSAGEVTIAAETLRLDGLGTPGQFTGVASSAESGSSGDAGTVSLTVDGLLEVLNGAQISSNTRGLGKAGEVTIAAGTVRLDGLGTPGQFTGVKSSAESGSSGDAGTVSLTALGLLEVLNGAEISSSTWGAGKAGEVTLTAGSARLDGTPGQFTGIASNAESGSSGDAGTVSLTVAGWLEMLNGVGISSSTWGLGKAGGVTITAGSARLDNFGTSDQGTGIASIAALGSNGDAGTVSLTVEGLLEVLNGASILSSTLGSGKAGGVTIVAESVRLDGFGVPNQTTGIASNANSGSSGDAGTVSLTVDVLLEVLNGAQISSSTWGPGKAGGVTLTAGSARLDNFGTPDQGTGIASTAALGSSGDAGMVSLTVDGLLEMLNGAEISSSTWGLGKAGEVTIAAESARLVGAPDQFTAITSGAWLGSSGDAGEVSLTVDDLLEVLNGAEISSSTVGLGKAGTIDIQGQTIHLDGSQANHCSIYSVAWEGATGDAGRIKIRSNILKIKGNANVSTGVDFGASGDAGSVLIQVERLLMDGSGIPIPEGSNVVGGVSSSVNTGGGRAGTVDIEATTSLELRDGMGISTASESSDAG
jgi:large exoprotein involved in heme utilization and adhesion